MEPELQNGAGETQPSFVFCTKCGNLCNAQETHCTGCGSELNAAEQPVVESKPADNNNRPQSDTNFYGNSANMPTYSYSDVYLQDEDAYIQANIDFYKGKFAKMKQNNSKVSWNWCTFLFGPYWLIYRKMYAFGFGLMAFNLIMAYGGLYLYLQTFTQTYSIISSLISLCLWLTLSLLGNYMYKSRIERLVDEGQRLDEPFKTKHIEKNGGVSLAVLLITLVAVAVISQIIYTFMFKSIILQSIS